MALGDNYVEVTAVGIQGLSTTETVIVVPGATGSTGPEGATGPQGASGVGGGGAITIVGSVASSTNLDPSYSGSAGDAYITTDTGHLWVWDGSSWVDTGAISGATGGGGNGATGATGPRGATGLTGATGIVGASGSAGSQGASGVAGASGIGATGAQGPAGASGVGGGGGNGATGVQGASGVAGASGISGASGYVGSDGATGVQGASGSTGLTGATGIGGSVSQWEASPASYDQYDIVSYEGNLYYWVSPTSGNSATNPALDSISWQIATGAGNGATGATGPQGNQGATGLTGASGYQGVDGATGIQGTDGASGPTGSTGLQGASGSTGLTGATGAAGAAGASGAGAPVQASFTTSSTDETIIDVIDTTLIRSAKYEMQESSGSNYSASELRLLHDGPYVFLTQYAGIGDSLGVFNTFFSPSINNYSSPDINNGGMSYWNGTTVRIYTTNEAIQQALLSIVPTTVVSLNNGDHTVTVATKCVQVSPGIYQFTVTTNRSPILLLTNLSWSGTGFCELRYTPNNAVTTLKYLRTTIS